MEGLRMDSKDFRIINRASQVASERIYHEVYDVNNTYLDYLKLLRAVTNERKRLDRHSEYIFTLINDETPLTVRVREELANLVIGELNTTLNTGSLARISSLDIAYRRPSLSFEYFNMDKIMLDIFKKPPVFGAITGPQGQGKSHFGVLLADLMTRNKPDRYTQPITVCTNLWIDKESLGARQMDRVKLVNRASQVLETPGNVLVLLDEAHLFWSKFNVQSKEDKHITFWLTLLRKFEHSLLLITNSFDKLPNYFIRLCNLKMQKQSQKTLFFVSDHFTQHIGKIPKNRVKYDSNKVNQFTIDMTTETMINMLNEMDGEENVTTGRTERTPRHEKERHKTTE
jgi:hypothetical protein